ncbi:MAG: DUF2723 domain-containing protein [Cyclobacteriaceae bacterium]
MGYQRINIITGWFAFLVALVTYWLTVEPTASFWDAGEFIACSARLQVPHPPGAPFFLLTGRMFSMLGGGDLEQIAYWVNILSVLSSAFFVLFIFWSITHLAKRILKIKKGEESTSDIILIMGAGLTGALACTFSDSFWFSAVEAEVYAMSAFFTGFVLWAILRWENLSEEQDRARWLILIAYMMGLSIGVHLLNLVAIPVLALIVYFKYYDKVTRNGIIATLAISGFVVIFILEGIIPGIPSLAGRIEILFVNSFGLPFGSGVIFFAIAFLAGLAYGIYYSVKHNKYILNTALLSFAFIMIGYSSYMMIPIRSSYNPPIDENNPEDIISFVSYLKREQYGSRPLFKGQYYTATLVDNKKGSKVYMRGEDDYVVKDYKVEQVFDSEHTTILPRMYSSSPNHVQKYQEVTGLKAGEKPSFGDNIYYLFKHQLGYQYMRYFLWNFVGRDSDIQGASWVGITDAFDDIPSSLAANRGRNIYFGLPLLLGIFGIFIQYKRDPKLFSAIAMLFFMTGIAIVLYLNTPPIEPRERDYIYAGSFYMFTIWIGFGVIMLYDMIRRISKQKKIAAVLATVLGLSIPILMASQTWDDHDRSERYFSVDAAKNYLASCAPNAILFTGGDNDTFPLWYAQEVEGYRRDVRVIVLSYFNTDWYIQQMMRPAYESTPLPFGLTAKHYQQGGLNDYLPVVENPNIKGAISAVQFLKAIEQEHPQLQIPTSISSYNSIPGRRIILTGIDTAKVRAMVPDHLKGNVQPYMDFNVKGRALEKKDLAVLDLIVNANWERPIYFNNTSLAGVNLELSPYMVQEGIATRLLPVLNPNPQAGFQTSIDVMYDNVMNKFQWRGLDNPDIYHSQDYMGFCLNSRSTFNTLVRALINDGDYERAKNALIKCLEVMPNESIPYDFFSIAQVDLLLKVGEPGLATHIAEVTSQDAVEWLDYYLDKGIKDPVTLQKKMLYLNELARAYRANDDRELANKYESLFTQYYQIIAGDQVERSNF